ncbi:ethanolamine-phosphate cytidylyltransferase [Arachis duranensis]|uniref:ethanolamine-phosphate cytidylyltransferase n=1 Tax=Arachis duranensis TaxID=130453 RepID=A0A9C6T4A6_ARADU|nr:ethanolamine-phosphate cytidylyltransferase [Arachis duranensis]XP_052109635.1 ethanolamine-phosphate cytidylyltransferase [Arachis duranensis]
MFSNGKGPGPDARIVYIDGAFDLFHAGHVEILKKARQLGDFLLVGIHSDETVSVDLRSCSGHGYRQTQFLILRRIQLTIFFRLREV